MSDYRAVNGVEVKRIVLTQTGTYNPEYLRPYMATATRNGLRDLADGIMDKGMTVVTQSDVVGYASNVLTLANEVTDDDLRDIENGWDEKHFSFMIECEENNGMGSPGEGDTVIITGYTDRLDFVRSTRGHDEVYIPPDLRFYITGIKRFNSSSRLIGNDQFIVARDEYGRNGRQKLNLIRPTDVAKTVMVNSCIAPDVKVINTIGGLSNASTPYTNRYTNNVASSYISSFLNAIITAENTLNNQVPDHFGGYNANLIQRDAEKFGKVDAYLREQSVLRPNSFIYNMRNQVSSFRNEAFFEYGDMVDNYGGWIEDITDIIVFDTVSRDSAGFLHDHNDVAGWDDRTNNGRNAVVATVIKQSITGIMIESMIQRCSLEITNRVGHGSNTINGFEVIVTQVMFARRLGGELERTFINNFMHELVSRVLLDASLDNVIDLDLVIDADIYGDIYIDVAIGGGEMIPFKSAGFSLALTAPTITYDTKAVQTIGASLNQVVDHVLRESSRY